MHDRFEGLVLAVRLAGRTGRLAVLWARCAVGVGLAATVLATFAAAHGNWTLAVVNGFLLVFNVGIAAVNYRIAERLKGARRLAGTGRPR